MKVGDIELDSNPATMLGQRQLSHDLAPAPSVGDVVSSLPVPQWIFWSLAMCGELGGLSLFLFVPASTWTFAPIFSVILFGLGVGFSVLGLLRWSNRARATDEADDGIFARRRGRVIATLQGESKPQTVDELARATGIVEAVLLPTLVRMKAEGEIEEDLDLDTGVWKYALTPAPSDQSHLCLEDRQSELQAKALRVNARTH